MTGRRVLLAAALLAFACKPGPPKGPVSAPKVLKLEDRLSGDVVRIRDAVKDKDQDSHRRAIEALEALQFVANLAEKRSAQLKAEELSEAFNLFVTRYERLEIALRAAHLLNPYDELEHGSGSGISFRVQGTEEVRKDIQTSIEAALKD